MGRKKSGFSVFLLKGCPRNGERVAACTSIDIKARDGSIGHYRGSLQAGNLQAIAACICWGCAGDGPPRAMRHRRPARPGRGRKNRARTRVWRPSRRRATAPDETAPSPAPPVPAGNLQVIGNSPRFLLRAPPLRCKNWVRFAKLTFSRSLSPPRSRFRGREAQRAHFRTK